MMATQHTSVFSTWAYRVCVWTSSGQWFRGNHYRSLMSGKNGNKPQPMERPDITHKAPNWELDALLYRWTSPQSLLGENGNCPNDSVSSMLHRQKSFSTARRIKPKLLNIWNETRIRKKKKSFFREKAESPFWLIILWLGISGRY